MPPTNFVPLRPTTLLLAHICRRCRQMQTVTTVRVATSAGDRAILCDELQAQLSLRIDAHGELCNSPRAVVSA